MLYIFSYGHRAVAYLYDNADIQLRTWYIDDGVRVYCMDAYRQPGPEYEYVARSRDRDCRAFWARFFIGKLSFEE